MAREDLTVHLKADDDLTPTVKKAADAVDKLDRKDVDVKINADSSGATSAFGKFKAGIADAEGGMGKLQAAGSGAFDALKGAAGGLALGAGSALVAFGVKAVGAFQDVALKAGELSDALGISTEDASRLNETAGDLGIGVDTLEASLGRMNKTAAASPDKFAAIGAQIAKNADGTTDVVRTFENVSTALNNIPDPAKRAAAAAAIFGKGWMSMAELIKEGGQGIADTLSSVESAKVVNAEQVAKAREFRDQLDQLKGVAESVSLEVGGRVAASISDLIELFDAGRSKIQAFADEVAKHVPQSIKDAADESGDSWSTLLSGPKDALLFGPRHIATAWNQIKDMFSSGANDISASVGDLGAATGDVNKRFTDLVWGQKQAADAAKATAQAQYEARTSFVQTADALKDWADATADALQGTEAFNSAVGSMDWGNAALKGATAGMSDFHDQFFGLADIASANEAAFDALGESLVKNGDSFDLNTEKGRANQKAVEDLSSTLDTQMAAAYHDSGGDMDTFKGKAAGIADTLKGRLQNELGLSSGKAQEMIERLGLMPDDVETRYELSGTEEARIKIGLLQGSIANLPKDVQTRVNQQIIVGDYQGALSTIQGYYNSHPATVKVNTVVGTIQAAGNRLFNGYSPAATGSMAPAGMAVAAPAAAPTAVAVSAVPTVTIPVRFALPSATDLARQIGPLRLSAKASLRAENRITGGRQ